MPSIVKSNHSLVLVVLLVLQSIPLYLRLCISVFSKVLPLLLCKHLFPSFLPVHAGTEVKSGIIYFLGSPQSSKFLTKTGQICKLLLEGNLVAINSWGFWLFPFVSQVLSLSC